MEYYALKMGGSIFLPGFQHNYRQVRKSGGLRASSVFTLVTTKAIKMLMISETRRLPHNLNLIVFLSSYFMFHKGVEHEKVLKSDNTIETAKAIYSHIGLTLDKLQIFSSIKYRSFSISHVRDFQLNYLYIKALPWQWPDIEFICGHPVIIPMLSATNEFHVLKDNLKLLPLGIQLRVADLYSKMELYGATNHFLWQYYWQHIMSKQILKSKEMWKYFLTNKKKPPNIRSDFFMDIAAINLINARIIVDLMADCVTVAEEIDKHYEFEQDAKSKIPFFREVINDKYARINDLIEKVSDHFINFGGNPSSVALSVMSGTSTDDDPLRLSLLFKGIDKSFKQELLRVAQGRNQKWPKGFHDNLPSYGVILKPFEDRLLKITGKKDVVSALKSLLNQ